MILILLVGAVSARSDALDGVGGIAVPPSPRVAKGACWDAAADSTVGFGDSWLPQLATTLQSKTEILITNYLFPVNL